MVVKVVVRNYDTAPVAVRAVEAFIDIDPAQLQFVASDGTPLGFDATPVSITWPSNGGFADAPFVGANKLIANVSATPTALPNGIDLQLGAPLTTTAPEVPAKSQTGAPGAMEVGSFRVRVRANPAEQLLNYPVRLRGQNEAVAYTPTFTPTTPPNPNFYRNSVVNGPSSDPDAGALNLMARAVGAELSVARTAVTVRLDVPSASATPSVRVGDTIAVPVKMRAETNVRHANAIDLTTSFTAGDFVPVIGANSKQALASEAPAFTVAQSGPFANPTVTVNTYSAATDTVATGGTTLGTLGINSDRYVNGQYNANPWAFIVYFRYVGMSDMPWYYPLGCTSISTTLDRADTIAGFASNVQRALREITNNGGIGTPQAPNATVEFRDGRLHVDLKSEVMSLCALGHSDESGTALGGGGSGPLGEALHLALPPTASLERAPSESDAEWIARLPKVLDSSSDVIVPTSASALRLKLDGPTAWPSAAIAAGDEVTIGTAFVRPNFNGTTRNFAFDPAAVTFGIRDATGAIGYRVDVTTPTTVPVTTALTTINLSLVPRLPKPVRVGDWIPVDVKVKPVEARYVTRLETAITFDANHLQLVQSTTATETVARSATVTFAPDLTGSAFGNPTAFDSRVVSGTANPNGTIDPVEVRLAIEGAALSAGTAPVTVATVYVRPRMRTGYDTGSSQTESLPIMFVGTSRAGDALAAIGAVGAARVRARSNAQTADLPFAVAVTPASDAPTTVASPPITGVRGTVGITLRVRSPYADNPDLASNADPFCDGRRDATCAGWVNYPTAPFRVTTDRFLDVAVWVDAGNAPSGAQMIDTMIIPIALHGGLSAPQIPILGRDYALGSGIVPMDGTTAFVNFDNWLPTLRLKSNTPLTQSTEVARLRLRVTSQGDGSVQDATPTVSYWQGAMLKQSPETGIFNTNVYALPDWTSCTNPGMCMQKPAGEFDILARVESAPAGTIQIPSRLQGRTSRSLPAQFAQVAKVELRVPNETLPARRRLTQSPPPSLAMITRSVTATEATVIGELGPMAASGTFAVSIDNGPGTASTSLQVPYQAANTLGQLAASIGASLRQASPSLSDDVCSVNETGISCQLPNNMRFTWAYDSTMASSYAPVPGIGNSPAIHVTGLFTHTLAFTVAQVSPSQRMEYRKALAWRPTGDCPTCADFEEAAGPSPLAGLDPGTYDVYLKGATSVGVLVKGVTLDPGRNTVVTGVVMREGDADGNDTIDVQDFAALSHGFNTAPGMPNWDGAVDFNQSNYIDMLDYSLLAANYGRDGAVTSIAPTLSATVPAELAWHAQPQSVVVSIEGLPSGMRVASGTLSITANRRWYSEPPSVLSCGSLTTGACASTSSNLQITLAPGTASGGSLIAGTYTLNFASTTFYPGDILTVVHELRGLRLLDDAGRSVPVANHTLSRTVTVLPDVELQTTWRREQVNPATVATTNAEVDNANLGPFLPIALSHVCDATFECSTSDSATLASLGATSGYGSQMLGNIDVAIQKRCFEDTCGVSLANILNDFTDTQDPPFDDGVLNLVVSRVSDQAGTEWRETRVDLRGTDTLGTLTANIKTAIVGSWSGILENNDVTVSILQCLPSEPKCDPAIFIQFGNPEFAIRSGIEGAPAYPFAWHGLPVRNVSSNPLWWKQYFASASSETLNQIIPLKGFNDFAWDSAQLVRQRGVSIRWSTDDTISALVAKLQATLGNAWFDNVSGGWGPVISTSVASGTLRVRVPNGYRIVNAMDSEVIIGGPALGSFFGANESGSFPIDGDGRGFAITVKAFDGVVTGSHVTKTTNVNLNYAATATFGMQLDLIRNGIIALWPDTLANKVTTSVANGALKVRINPDAGFTITCVGRSGPACAWYNQYMGGVSLAIDDDGSGFTSDQIVVGNPHAVDVELRLLVNSPISVTSIGLSGYSYGSLGNQVVQLCNPLGVCQSGGISWTIPNVAMGQVAVPADGSPRIGHLLGTVRVKPTFVSQNNYISFYGYWSSNQIVQQQYLSAPNSYRTFAIDADGTIQMDGLDAVAPASVRTSAVRTRSTTPNADLWLRNTAGVTKVGDVVPVHVGLSTGTRTVDGAQVVLQAGPGVTIVDKDGNPATASDAVEVSGGPWSAFRQAIDTVKGTIQLAVGRTVSSGAVSGDGVLATVFVKVAGPPTGDLLTFAPDDGGSFRTLVAGGGDDLTGQLVGLGATTVVDVPVAPVVTSAQPPVVTSAQPPVVTSAQPPVVTSAQPPVVTSAQPPVVTSASRAGGPATTGSQGTAPSRATMPISPLPSASSSTLRTGSSASATSVVSAATSPTFSEDVARGTITLTVPGRGMPIELATGLATVEPDAYCPVARHRTYVRLVDVGIAGATFGVGEGGVLTWVTPDQAGCVDWGAIEANGLSFDKRVIMQFTLDRAAPGALLWVLEGDRHGELYEVDATGIARYVTADDFAANQDHFTEVWRNVIPVSSNQIDGLNSRGSVSR